MPHDLSTKEIDWFWSQVEVTDNCWYWTGSTANGYGAFRRRRRTYIVHRLAYELAYGDIPDGLLVMHTCDHPPCCNPQHLSTGTHAENMADRARKQRWNGARAGLSALLSRIRRPRKTHAERFWEKVDQSGDCWPWTGATTWNGYGKMGVRGKTTGAHCIAYTLTYGAIPEGLDVCHTCDCRLCCNPAHLFVGTRRENLHDAREKGRTARGDRHWTHRYPEMIRTGDKNPSRAHPERIQHGEKHYMTHLTDADVLEIRRLAAEGHQQKALAERYGITTATISRIIQRKTWRHLP